MINWFDMPAEGLSNGGLFEVKELEVTENGTYETKGEMYNKVTVNVEGGGSSWQTVFEGSVTTVSDDPAPIGSIENLSLNADTIKVTFNGTEYECNKHADGSYGASFDESTEQFDWSTYPFALANLSAGNPRVDIYTETAGTYTLKIEEPQSGGSSDFSTAEVTIVNNYLSEFIIEVAVAMSEEGMNASLGTLTAERIDTGIAANVILYKGSAGAIITGFPLDTPPTIATSGNIQNMEDNAYLITGDCTITIS